MYLSGRCLQAIFYIIHSRIWFGTKLPEDGEVTTDSFLRMCDISINYLRLPDKCLLLVVIKYYVNFLREWSGSRDILQASLNKHCNFFYCFTLYFNSLNLTYQLMHFYIQ